MYALYIVPSPYLQWRSLSVSSASTAIRAGANNRRRAGRRVHDLGHEQVAAEKAPQRVMAWASKPRISRDANSRRSAMAAPHWTSVFYKKEIMQINIKHET
jgi:hypothetical protein